MKQLLFIMTILISYSVSAQNVGIGTTNPLTRLHVTDSSVLFSAAGPIDYTQGFLPIEGAGRRILWYPHKAAFRVGYVDGDQWNRLNIGVFSFASGSNSIASGVASTSIGVNTTASDFYTIAMGLNTIASDYSSVAIGYNNNASAPYSLAMGEYTNASGTASIAMGSSTFASAFAAVAIGYGTYAKAFGSISIGNLNDDTDNPDPDDYQPDDRIFQLGNGTITRSNAITVLRNGNVGIGTITPGFPLNFAAATGDKISLYGTSGAHYGLGIQGYLLQIHTDGASADIAFGHGSSGSFTETMRIQGNGNVGIGITNPNAPLGFPATLGKKITLYPGGTGDVGMAVQGNQFLIYSDHPDASVRLGYDQAGVFQYNLDVYGNGNATLRGTLTQNSDVRLKKDLLPLENSLEKISKLNGYHYYWKNDNYDEGIQMGLIAQEVQKYYPELVKEDSDGILSVNYSGLIPVLIESIKEQQTQIDDLKKLIMEQGQQTADNRP